ncbi:MAG: hypothetical protein J7M26_09040, partial [Armatimonadetes bacterium]|nr:hypothetical protein [Armatimonadota bacterium]
NAASEVWQKKRAPLGFRAGEEDRDKQEEDIESQVRQALRASDFPPEFVSRLSHVLLFRPLETEHLRTLAAKRLATLAQQAFDEDLVVIEYSEDLLDWLMDWAGEVQDCRRVMVAVQRLVEMPLARWRSTERFKLREAVLVTIKPGKEAAAIQASDDPLTVRSRMMGRLAETYENRRRQEERWRAARVILGSASSR